VDNTIIVIAFLAPGLLAVKIGAAMDPEYKDRISKASELESTVLATLNNLPGILFSWLLWCGVQNKNLSFAQWSSQVTQLPGVIFFLLISFSLALLAEMKIKPFIKELAGRKRDKDRKNNGLPSFGSSESWEIFLGSEDEVCLRIRHMAHGEAGRIVGILRSAFRPEDLSKGITLENTAELAALDNWLFDPTRTYLDSQTGIVYELFIKRQLDHAAELALESNQVDRKSSL